VIKNKQKSGEEFVQLQEIYEELEKLVTEKNLNYKMDTFRNSIRGELNTHENNSRHPSNIHLFVRSTQQKGLYSLTDIGKNYQGR
jgi:hypothetical protein